MEKLVIFQIDKFPKVPSAYNFIVPKVIIRILVSIQPKGEIFTEFLSEIGIIFSIVYLVMMYL